MRRREGNGGLRGTVCLLFFAFFLCAGYYAAAQQAGAARRNGLPYLIPQTVFVGDRAQLVAPLGSAFAGMEPFVLENSARLPQTQDLRIHRLELEHRGDLPRLLVDFTAYAPGVLEIPPFPELGISGLTVNIASILDAGGDGLVLSNPASPLPAPGTMFVIYGTVTGIIILLLAGIGGGVWGRRHLGDILERRRRRRLISLMGKVERRLRLNLLRGESGSTDYAETLACLSGEFRTFLGYFSGLNCRAMTAGEFFSFSILGDAAAGTAVFAETAASAPVLTGEYLGGLFRRIDRLRFSGEGIGQANVLDILNGVKNFLDALGQAVRSSIAMRSSATAQGGRR
jgi:hypothetical protein